MNEKMTVKQAIGAILLLPAVTFGVMGLMKVLMLIADFISPDFVR